jgi:CHRD domain
MKYLLIVLFSFTIAFNISSCTKGGELDGVSGKAYTVTSSASSKQLLPLIDTTSTATLKGSFDDQTNILTFTLAWDDLWKDTKKDTITGVNFYVSAAITANGPLVRALSYINTNRTGTTTLGLSGYSGLSNNEKTQFLAGSYYFIIATKRYPNGIVRGQLIATQ